MQLIGGQSKRIQAIDIARALAIIGVVFNHTVDGLVTAQILDGSTAVAAFNQALYIFRMPALAFVLGLFMARGTEKRGTRGYIREKVTFALYVYLVWFALQTLVEIATSRLKNTPRGWGSLLEVWSMPAHLWFMPFLATSAVLISIAAPWRNSTRALVVLGVTTAVSLIAWGWNPPVFGMRGMSLLIFTAAGAAIGFPRLGLAMARSPFAWACFGVATLSGFILMLRLGVRPGTLNDADAYNLGDNALSVIAAGLGVVTLLSLAVVLSRIPGLQSGIGSIGKKTLEIYLAHVMVVAGTRIALEMIGVSSEFAFLTAAMLLGIGIPLALAVLAPRLHMKWLFQVPKLIGNWSREENKMDSCVGRRPQ